MALQGVSLAAIAQGNASLAGSSGTVGLTAPGGLGATYHGTIWGPSTQSPSGTSGKCVVCRKQIYSLWVREAKEWLKEGSKISPVICGRCYLDTKALLEKLDSLDPKEAKKYLRHKNIFVKDRARIFKYLSKLNPKDLPLLINDPHKATRVRVIYLLRNLV